MIIWATRSAFMVFCPEQFLCFEWLQAGEQLTEEKIQQASG